MSRAFTKEIDDAPVPRPLEHPIGRAPNLVTPRGAAMIVAKALEIADRIASTQDPETLDALRRDQRYWEARRASMQIVPPSEDGNEVAFGTSVRIRRRGKMLTVHIVGEDEADPATGLIAWTSPLARALTGAEVGEAVSLGSDDRSEAIDILAINPLPHR